MKSSIAFFVIFLMTTNAFSQKPLIEWVNIPAGIFIMGSPQNELDRNDDEIQHKVALSAFKMSKYEITVAQFKAFVDATGYNSFMEKGPDGMYGSDIWETNAVKAGVNWKCDENGNLRLKSEYNHPVIHVSWTDANAFAEWINCRLPTEAEWEYACRAGSVTPFNTGRNLTTSQANYHGNFPYSNYPKGEFREKTVPVGSFVPNSFGLFDMHGNVWEWCYDWYGEYSRIEQINPKGPTNGQYRVLRGGCWNVRALLCRSSYRSYGIPNTPHYSHGIGFRLVSL